MIWETWVQFQVASYQRLEKWYLIPPCLTLSNIRYVSRVKWRNPGKGVAAFPTPRCRRYWKESLLVALDYGRQLYLYIYLHRHLVMPSAWISLTLSRHPLHIVHCFRQILWATPCILTELLYVGLSWLPCFCSAMWRGPYYIVTKWLSGMVLSLT